MRPIFEDRLRELSGNADRLAPQPIEIP
jgi:hypothetical protein